MHRPCHRLEMQLCLLAHSCNSLFPIFLGPENAPVGVLVKRMTSKMLEIQWSPPEHDPCTVEVTSYDVSVVILDTVKRKHKYIFNTTKSNGFNVTDLRPKCEYNVTVRARTVAGAGPFTLPYIITFTPAEGMLRNASTFNQYVSFSFM